MNTALRYTAPHYMTVDEFIVWAGDARSNMQVPDVAITCAEVNAGQPAEVGRDDVLHLESIGLRWAAGTGGQI